MKKYLKINVILNSWDDSPTKPFNWIAINKKKNLCLYTRSALTIGNWSKLYETYKLHIKLNEDYLEKIKTLNQV